MPAIPIVVDVDALRRGVTEDLTLATRSLHSVGHIILRRDTDNHIAEVVAVVATIVVSMGLLMYWGITKEGSCNWRPAKK
ncbi:hypothetical protein SCUCBS95973_004749 [Sporothrix curviconia]|uniref:Uncharacterized protein n=1 Tax=Sporothrix curviconia TaxID=1260050 RepID=A0ABP0BRD6_9PEZI